MSSICQIGHRPLPSSQTREGRAVAARSTVTAGWKARETCNGAIHSTAAFSGRQAIQWWLADEAAALVINLSHCSCRSLHIHPLLPFPRICFLTRKKLVSFTLGHFPRKKAIVWRPELTCNGSLHIQRPKQSDKVLLCTETDRAYAETDTRTDRFILTEKEPTPWKSIMKHNRPVVLCLTRMLVFSLNFFEKEKETKRGWRGR